MNEHNSMLEVESQAKEMASLHYITEENAVFNETEGGFVGMTYNGNVYERVKVTRLFPFTDPDKFISIRTSDENPKEIGIIENLADMDEKTVSMLNAQLDLTYFTPVIKKIISIKDDYGYAYFHVVTDKGECKFAINMGGSNVAKLTDSRLIITDLDENRFEIRDVFALTGKEQRKLDLFL